MNAYLAIFPQKHFIWNATICFSNDSFVFIFSKISFIFQCLVSYISFYFHNHIYIFLTDKQSIISITLFAFFLPPSFRKKHKIAFLVSESYDVFMVKYSSLLPYLFHCLQTHMKYRDNELILRKTYIVPFMSAFLQAILNVADYYFSLWWLRNSFIVRDHFSRIVCHS